MARKRLAVLAVASAGGHWQQLMALREALPQENVAYVTTLEGLPQQEGISNYTVVPDCNRKKLSALLVLVFRLLSIVIRLRPRVVITTGAMPGLVALGIAKLVFARTIWVDSVANAETMSLSGKCAKWVAHYRLSQWEHVAFAEGADYEGSIL